MSNESFKCPGKILFLLRTEAINIQVWQCELCGQINREGEAADQDVATAYVVLASQRQTGAVLYGIRERS